MESGALSEDGDCMPPPLCSDAKVVGGHFKMQRLHFLASIAQPTDRH